MVNSKLIIIEGLPGSGKSTTAYLVQDILNDMNVNNKLFLEGNLEHPADYDTVSYFTKHEFENLVNQHPESHSQLVEHSEERCHGYIVPRYKLSKANLSDKLNEKLWEHDIYELPLDLHIELLTDNWRRFTEKAQKSDQTYIFECCFIQNPVTIGMVKYGVSDDIVMQYVKKLAHIIEPLNPILIYVDQKDFRTSFKKALEERPKEWANGFMDYYNNQGYGKIHGAEGLEGTLSVLEAREKLEAKIFDDLKMRKFKVDNSKFDKETHKTRMVEKILVSN